MAEPQYLLSINRFSGDGIQTVWNINFAGGYLSRSHVKAYVQVEETGEAVGTITLTDDNFVGANQIEITPAVAVGNRLTIYRDTPKDFPLVNFSGGALLNERNLDKLAQQAVFVSAEMVDRFGTTIEDFNLASAAIADARDAALQAASDAAAVASNFAALQIYVEGRLDQQDDNFDQLVLDTNAAIAAFESSITNTFNTFETNITNEFNTFTDMVTEDVEVIDGKVQEVLDSAWRYDIAAYMAFHPKQGDALFRITVPRTATLATNAPGAHFVANDLPIVSTEVSIQKNDVEIGTVTMDTDGSVIWAVTETEFVAGDQLSFISDYVTFDAGFNDMNLVVRLEI